MSRLPSILLIGALSLAGCDQSSTLPGGPGAVAFLTENAAGTPGWLLDEALEVRVTSRGGAPVAGAEVHWSTTVEGGEFAEPMSITNADGIARVDFTPGWARGTQQVTATVDDHTASLDVQVTSMEFAATEVLDRRVCGLDTEGQMWCWPEYTHVQPTQLDPARRPLPVATDLRFTALRSHVAGFADRGFLCGITTDGELWCATEEDFPGPHGSASSVPTLHLVETPAPVADWSGGGSFARNACIIDHSGNAWCRGQNTLGQLGDGTFIDSENWSAVSGGLRFAEITVGITWACAIALDGRPYCWGANNNARLGIGSGVTKLTTPTPVDGDLRLQRISLAAGGLCGIAAHGTPDLLCWGNVLPARRVSEVVPSGLQGIPATAISLAGDDFGGRTVHDGRLYRFGYNGGWVADMEFYDDQLEPNLTNISRLLSRTSYYWCVEHASGSTLCSTMRFRPVGVPLPETDG